MPWRILFGLVAGVCACLAPPVRVFPQDAYVWQRRWTPAVAEALRAASGDVAGWRVLAAEWHGRPVKAEPAWETLRASERPVVAVFRIEGRSEEHAGVPAFVRDVLARWRAEGVSVAGVELDHDCPESRLFAYRGLLAGVRRSIGGARLSITALPAWLGHRELPLLLREVDEAVLQVHAVMDPRRGLFDAAQARQWLARWAELSPVPYRVALPAYGSRVSWDARGRVSAIESEEGRYGLDAESEELFASPVEVSRLLTELRVRPPAGRFLGVVWFRLPVAGDRRAWSTSSWRAVLRGGSLLARVSARVTAGDVVLVNDGGVDAELPAFVRVAGSCGGAEGVGGYEWRPNGFVRAKRQWLRAGERRVIGWLRCEEGTSVQVLEAE